MKRLFLGIAALFVAISIFGQPGITLPPYHAPILAQASNAAPTNGLAAVITSPPAVPAVTENGAVHSNFGIGNTWLVVLIPFAIALLKRFAPSLPKKYLPIIAPALGAVLDGLTSYLTGTTVNPALGAVLGAAAVGLREVYDQFTNPTQTTPLPPPTGIVPTPPPPTTKTT